MTSWRKRIQTKLVSISLSVLTAIVIVVGVVGSQEAEALPSHEVYHVYYYDSAMTQYAGEELILGCYGKLNMMIEGQRANYYVSVKEPCNWGSRSSGCTACPSIRGYPLMPVCSTPTSMICPPYLIR